MHSRAMRRYLAIFGIVIGAAACNPVAFVEGAVDVNEGMDSANADERELASIEGQLLLTLGLGTCGAFVVVIGFRWFRSSGSSGKGAGRQRVAEERTSREIGEQRLQGVLTIQLVVAAEVQASLGAFPPQGSGRDQVAAMVAHLTQHRAHWKYLAARGSAPMESEAAAAESNRLLSIFRTRVSGVDHQGPSAALLTVVVRAPLDFHLVMPGDLSGFELAVAPLHELSSQDSCNYAAEWSSIPLASVMDIVPDAVLAG